MVGRLQHTKSATIIHTPQTNIIHTQAIRFEQSNLNNSRIKMKFSDENIGAHKQIYIETLTLEQL